MFCMNCGTQLPDGAKFCFECGSKINASILQPKVNIPKSTTQLVAAKCTNCNANLQVDPDQQAAICPYCGTPYIVEKAIQNFKINNTYIETQINIQGVDSENLISLAESAIKSGKYSEAIDYANRALETDPSNVDGWIIKIKVSGYDIEGDRSSEIYSFVESALDKDDTLENECKIYDAVLDVAKIHIQEAISLLKSNTERIEKQLRDRRDRNDIAAMDSGYIARTTQITNEAIEYRNIIPDGIISSNESLLCKTKELADIYNRYYDALENRLNLYSASLTFRMKNKRKENVQRILAGQGITNETPPEMPGRKSIFDKFFNQ